MTNVSILVDSAIKTSGLTAAQIAREMGVKPNFISAIRTGASPLPYVRAEQLGKICNLSDRELARLVLAVMVHDDRESAGVIARNLIGYIRKIDRGEVAAPKD